MMEEKNALNTRDFSKVIITLENVLVPIDKLSPTPSEQDGLKSEVELDLRILGCDLIQTSGILLRLPQVAMATGMVLFQRFYFSKSFVKHSMEVVAMACINLAAKIEEAPRRLRDVMNVFHHIKQVRSRKTISPLTLDQNYINLKNQAIKAERRVLKELGFCVHVKHPHKIIVMFLQVLECERNRALVQCAWNYMNDSFRTNVFVRFRSETIACACIFLAARQLKIALPNRPPWYHLFDAKEEELKEISKCILLLYRRSKPNFEYVEEEVNKLKKAFAEAKLKAKGLLPVADSASRPSTPMKVESPMSTQLKRAKDDERHSVSSFGHNIDQQSRKKVKAERSPKSVHSRSPTNSNSDRSGKRRLSNSQTGSPRNKQPRSPDRRKGDRSRDKDEHRRSKDKKRTSDYKDYKKQLDFDKDSRRYSDLDKEYKRSRDYETREPKYYSDIDNRESKRHSTEYDNRTYKYADYEKDYRNENRDYKSDSKEAKRKRLAISPITYARHNSQSPPPPKKSKKSSKDKYYRNDVSLSPLHDKVYEKVTKRHANGHRSKEHYRH